MVYERESIIEKHLAAAVKAAGGVAYKFVSPGRRSVPDRIVLLPGGRIVFVECKSPGKAPRADQLREHERLRALGFNVVVLDSKNLEGILCGAPITTK
ncbi:VRR-NUC domain [Klebsiella pneumoniae]|uniref:VRR-NUC domain n=1 Tax=Klebsiella pneumoniae TaxID=573 RepID=A0AB74GMY3_KLEPN|nr:VRR-NUC domain-containing protein [Klebsiella pneumoniae subsp. ozaenae]STR95614.1 VRR-NUC domain [Klebsiella pneumoniae]STU45000.1 VRR-NUC domain [Klebsiella pneumoniae]HBY9793025.1 VRR-NUC domain-containing protein [Klebsiella pneumoniae]HDH0767267.1 VRR-NUC domain-containing protein [Klebsiella pneumoniae]